MTEHLQILQKKLPSDIDPDFIYKIAENSSLIEMNKDDILINQGTKDQNAYFISKGSFLRSILTTEGELKTVMFHTEDFQEIIICSDSFYFNTTTEYSIIANEKSVVRKINHNFIESELHKNTPFLRFYSYNTDITFSLIELLRNKQVSLSSEQYLSWLFKNYSFIFKRFAAKDIASFMGITPVWLSKLKKKITS